MHSATKTRPTNGFGLGEPDTVSASAALAPVLAKAMRALNVAAGNIAWQRET